MMIAPMPATWPMRLVEERIEVVRVHEHQEEEDPEGDERDDPARELALSRQHRDEPAYVHARTDVRRHLVEHLRGVAACLALNEREHGDLVDVARSASAGRSPRAPRRAGCRAARRSRRGGTRAWTAPAPRPRRRPSRPRGCGRRGGRTRGRRGSPAAARRSRSGPCAPCPARTRLRTIGGRPVRERPRTGRAATPATTATSSPTRTETQTILRRIVLDLGDVDVLREAFDIQRTSSASSASAG